MNEQAQGSESTATGPSSRYPRQQAIENGELVDVSHQADKAGIDIPVAVTQGVWTDACEWTKDDELRCNAPHSGQSTDGRLWYLLWLAGIALSTAKKRGADEGRLQYTVLRKPRPGNGRTRKVTLHVCVGPGDGGEPVATITQTDED